MDVLNDKYTLVIGNENILNPDIEPTGDVHHFFLRKVNEKAFEKYENYYEIALDKNERINPIRKLIENNEIQFRAEDVSRELTALLETKLFTTVLTTTTDGYLETVMKKVWGNDLRIVNIYNKDEVDNLQKAIRNCRRGQKYNQPTLIYVFGKQVIHQDDNQGYKRKYVNTDSEAIKLIEKWMRMEVEDNNEILQFIRSKRLLALGCKYENWYFRFFWYVLTGICKPNDDDDEGDGMGEVAFCLDENDKTESKLLKFLGRTDICVLGDTKRFINEILATLNDDSPNAQFRKMILEKRRRGGIFISYCNKDKLVASQLFACLCVQKYDVWFDNVNLYGGDDYEKEINDAINEAKVVITILTPNVADDLKFGRTNHYYNKEWRTAQQFNNKKIIPLAVNGYNLRSNYHSEYDKIIPRHLSGIDLMETDGFNKLVSSIDENM